MGKVRPRQGEGDGRSAHGRLPRHGRCSLMTARSNRNQTTDLDDLVTWQIEVIGHVGGVPLHYGEKLFLPPWQPPPVLATGNRLVPDEIGDVGEIDGTSAFLELRQ